MAKNGDRCPYKLAVCMSRYPVATSLPITSQLLDLLPGAHCRKVHRLTPRKDTNVIRTLLRCIFRSSGAGSGYKLAASCALIACGTVHATTCVNEGGTTAYIDSNTSDLRFVTWQPEGDYYFAILNAAGYQRIDQREPNEVVFFVEGLRLGFKTLEVSQFVDAGQTKPATELLPAYVAWHANRAADLGLSHKKSAELKRTQREAYRSTPVTYFLRWRLFENDPQDVRGIYFLSTVTASG